MKKVALLLVFTLNCSILIGSCSSEPSSQFEIKWSCTYGGSLDDMASYAQKTADGGFVIIGRTLSHAKPESYGRIFPDIWLVKTDLEGRTEWSRTFGGSYWDNASSIKQTTDGGYIIAGTTCSNDFGDGDLWLIKTDSSGEEEWNNTFREGKDNKSSCIYQTDDGGYIVLGCTVPYGDKYSDFWLIKVDASGIEQWTQTFGGPKEDKAEWIEQTVDGGYIVIGWTSSHGSGKNDVWLIKTDKFGEMEWERVFGEEESDSASCVQQTNDGGYIIAGQKSTSVLGFGDAWLIKTDTHGNEEWSHLYSNDAGTYGANHVVQTTDGDYVFTGVKWSYDEGFGDAWIVKVDQIGQVEWQQTFGGDSIDTAFWVHDDNDGGYVLAGNTASSKYNRDNLGYWLFKIEK